MLSGLSRCLSLSGALVAVAAGATEVHTSHKPGTDFAAYSTYAWRTDPRLGPNHPLAEGSDLDQRIRDAGDEVLARAGLTKTTGDPDLWVTYVGFVTDHLTIEGERRELAEGVAWIGTPHAHSTLAYREGTLVFEILDGVSQELVWSGWASELAATTDRLRRKAEKGARRILRHFPPARGR